MGNENKFRIECREDTRSKPFMSLISMDFAENPIQMFMVLSRGCWVSVYLFMLGQAGSDLTVSGSSSPEVNMVIWSSSQRCRQTRGRQWIVWSTPVSWTFLFGAQPKKLYFWLIFHQNWEFFQPCSIRESVFWHGIVIQTTWEKHSKRWWHLMSLLM